MGKFSSEQMKEILAITYFQENTLMKFCSSSMEMLENKIERLSNKSTLLKEEVESLKTGADFKLKEQKHQQLEEKFLSLKID